MPPKPRTRADKYGISPMQEAALFRSHWHLAELMEGVFRPDPKEPNFKRINDIIQSMETLLGY